MGGDIGSLDDDNDDHPYGEDDDDSDSNWVVNKVATDDIDDNGAGEEAATYNGDDIEIEDVETSGDEWQMAKEQVGEFRKQISKISETKSTAVENETIIDEAVGGGTERQSEYEDSEAKMETSDESDEEDNMFLRRKKRAPRVDDNIDFKKLKWQVGMCFATAQKFKDAIVRFALVQSFDLKFNISDARRKRFQVVCKGTCNFKAYASWDKRNATYIMKSVSNQHRCTRNMPRNRQLKPTWVARNYIMKFKEKPHWSAKEIMNKVKNNFGVCISKCVAYKIREVVPKILYGSMKEHHCKLESYIEEIKRSNNSSTFLLETDPPITQEIPIFKRFFVCFNGLRVGMSVGVGMCSVFMLHS